MAAYKVTYTEAVEKDIKHIYAGVSDSPAKKPMSNIADQTFEFRILRRMLQSRMGPHNAAHVGPTGQQRAQQGDHTEAPAFRELSARQIEKIVSRLRRPTVSSARLAGIEAAGAKPRCQPVSGPQDQSPRTLSPEQYAEMIQRLHGTHTHASRMARERDVSVIMRDINAKIDTVPVFYKKRLTPQRS